MRKPEQVTQTQGSNNAEQVVLPSVFAVSWRPGIQGLLAC